MYYGDALWDKPMISISGHSVSNGTRRGAEVFSESLSTTTIRCWESISGTTATIRVTFRGRWK